MEKWVYESLPPEPTQEPQPFFLFIIIIIIIFISNLNWCLERRRSKGRKPKRVHFIIIAFHSWFPFAWYVCFCGFGNFSTLFIHPFLFTLNPLPSPFPRASPRASTPIPPSLFLSSAVRRPPFTIFFTLKYLIEYPFYRFILSVPSFLFSFFIIK